MERLSHEGQNRCRRPLRSKIAAGSSGRPSWKTPSLRLLAYYLSDRIAARFRFFWDGERYAQGSFGRTRSWICCLTAPKSALEFTLSPLATLVPHDGLASPKDAGPLPVTWSI